VGRADEPMKLNDGGYRRSREVGQVRRPIVEERGRLLEGTISTKGTRAGGKGWRVGVRAVEEAEDDQEEQAGSHHAEMCRAVR